MKNVLNFKIEMKGRTDRMYKLIILAITIGGFVFAGSWNNIAKSDAKSNPLINQYCWVEDTSDDDNKLERRRRGKGHRGRRRGGGGLK